jgi:molecular chaperone GrpE
MRHSIANRTQQKPNNKATDTSTVGAERMTPKQDTRKNRIMYLLRRQRNKDRRAEMADATFDNATPVTATESSDENAAAVTELTNEVAELKDALLRSRADFDNFRRRSQKEREDNAVRVREEVYAKLLPVLDNFERAMSSSQQATDLESIRTGIAMIATQLQSALQSDGLEKIDSEGQPFDPNIHDAVSTVERADIPENTVVEVFASGYMLRGKCVRPAMVVVSKAPNS